jgi:uncharacterized protein (TIGR02118 family)
MHTIVFACRRLPTLSRTDYERHYWEVHAPLASALPGLVEYRQMLIRDDYEWQGQEREYDSISTYVFTDDAAAEAAWASPEGIAVNDDTGKFMDWDTVIAYPGTDTGVYAGRAARV